MIGGQATGQHIAVPFPDRHRSEPANILVPCQYAQGYAYHRRFVQPPDGRPTVSPSFPMVSPRRQRCAYSSAHSKIAEEEDRRGSMLGPREVSSFEMMAQFVSPCFPTRTHVTIHGQRPQGEVLAIPMVPKVKDARKSRPSVGNLLP